MKIEIYEQRILIPDTGKWLYNSNAQVISDKVYLAKEASAFDWEEITEERKAELETEWNKEIEEV